MTALQRYLRLEAVGQWREAPDAAPREVVVSLGRATLLLSDMREQPLGHWALGGIRVLNERDAAGATVYAMSAGETLAIRDRDMVDAIAAVRRALPEPPPARRRYIGRILAVLALVLLVAAGPPYVRQVTAGLIPAEQEADLGARMLAVLVAEHGPPCDDPAGVDALEKLGWSLAGSGHAQIRVMRIGDLRAAALPGNILLLGRAAIETEPQNQISGWIFRASDSDGAPLRNLVLQAGFVADVRYIRTGHFDDAAVARAAETALRLPARSALRGEYDLTDADWQAIRGICR